MLPKTGLKEGGFDLLYYRGQSTYAFYGPGQWFRVMPILKRSYLHTHFAGEHLAEWQGFMEGAINKGEEAAEKI